MARKKKSVFPLRHRNEHEQAVFDWIVGQLDEKGLLSSADYMMIDITSHTYAKFISYQEELDRYEVENGTILQTSPNGYQQPHQLVHLVNNMKVDLMKQLDKLGMNLEAITKITKEKKSTEQKVVDPFDEFVKGHPDN